MGSDCGAFTASPFFWVTLAALFAGAGTSRATMRVRPGRGVERRRAAKWTVFSLLWSVAVLLLLAAVFVPGAEKIVDPRLLHMGGGSLFLFFLSFRFKRAVGLPVLILLMTVSLFFVLALEQYRCRPPADEPPARFRVTTVEDQRITVELVLKDGGEEIHEVTGSMLVVGARLLHSSDYYFFAGKPYLVGDVVFGAPDAPAESALPAAAGDDVRSRLQSVLLRLVDRLPGFYASISYTEAFEPSPLFGYVLTVDDEGAAAVGLRNP